MEQSFITNRFAICNCRKFYNVPFYVRWDNQQLKSKIYQILLLLKRSKDFLKIAAQTSEAAYYLIFSEVLGVFEAHFLLKIFLIKKHVLIFGTLFLFVTLSKLSGQFPLGLNFPWRSKWSDFISWNWIHFVFNGKFSLVEIWAVYYV